jgi:hypothetical protein
MGVETNNLSEILKCFLNVADVRAESTSIDVGSSIVGIETNRLVVILLRVQSLPLSQLLN